MSNPTGFCECGCGERTPIATYTSKQAGITRGEPLRFVRHHHASHFARLRFADRFWSKVDRPSDSECWNWLGTMHRTGYGHFSVGAARMVSAHRVAFELINGAIPDGAHVLHVCDNKRCVNPAHLRLGTNRENCQEAWDRGLQRKRVGGELSWTRYTAGDIRAIRMRHASGESVRRLAVAYGMSYTNAKDIIARRIWKHVT